MMSSVARPPTDVTKCPTCYEPLADPRQLPCVHSFCLKCIETWSRDAEPGRRVPCPLCRKEFEIPFGGVDRLPRNHFVEKLVEVRKVTAALENKDSECEVCGGGGEQDGTGAEVKRSAQYCVQCQQHMCANCAQMHRRMKATSDHRLVDLTSPIQTEDLRQLTTLPPTQCDLHPKETIKIYCNDCRVAVCMLCHLDRHNSHACVDVTRVASDLRRRVKDDVVSLTDDASRCNVEALRLERAKADFANVVVRVEAQIAERADQLRRLVDAQARRLMEELTEAKDERRREVEALEGEIQRHRTALESFSRYCEQLIDHGTACDVAASSEALHARAVELGQFDVGVHVLRNFRSLDVSFARSDVETTLTPQSGNLVGRLIFRREDEERRAEELRGPSTPAILTTTSPQATAALPTSPATPAAAVAAAPVATGVTFQETPPGHPVLGVAVLKDELFVTRNKTSEVEVFDATTLTPTRTIAVSGLGSWPYGLAACPVNNCLYVSDFVNNTVHKVGVASDATGSTRWAVVGGPAGVTVNFDSNVVVACSSAIRIQIFTTNGEPVLEFGLPVEMAGLSHVFQTSADQFVVTHGTITGKLHRLCIVEKAKAEAVDAAAAASGTPDAGDGAGEKSHHRKLKLPSRRSESSKKSVRTASTPASTADPRSAEAQVVHSFGGAPGGGERQLNGPKGLVVDGRGRIFVADRENNRIVIVAQSLEHGRNLSTWLNDLDIQGPRCVWLDEARDRLYVGEENGGRVLAIDRLGGVIDV